MDKFLNSKYWEERDITLFSVIMGIMPSFLLSYITDNCDSILIKIIVVTIGVISFFVVTTISHFISNTILDIILDRINNMGEKKVIFKFLGFFLLILDVLIFIAIVIWSLYKAFSIGEYIVLIIIPIYFFIYYYFLSAPILSIGYWLHNNIKIDSDEKDFKGEV